MILGGIASKVVHIRPLGGVMSSSPTRPLRYDLKVREKSKLFEIDFEISEQRVVPPQCLQTVTKQEAAVNLS